MRKRFPDHCVETIRKDIAQSRAEASPSDDVGPTVLVFADWMEEIFADRDEADREAERLHKQISDAQDAHLGDSTEGMKLDESLRAEIERLRVALRLVADQSDMGRTGECGDIARAALADSQTGGETK